MEKYYKVVFVYPDGHIEEIDDQFVEGKDALEAGNSLLNQVLNTEGQFHKDSYEDQFGFKERKEPHFMIVEISRKKYRLVYDSKAQ